jgi:hypothetical protein
MKGFGRLFLGLVLSLCLCVSVVKGQSAVPSVVAFGAGPVGTAMATQATVFTNTSASTLASLSVSASGTNSGDFSLSTNPSTNCGGLLTAGSACTVTVTFTPGGVGARTASISFSWTGGSYSVALSGTGLAQFPQVASAYTNATTTFSNVSPLYFFANAGGNYRFVCRITWQGSATTTGPKYQFTGPASPTSVAIGATSNITSSTYTSGAVTAFSTAFANTGTITATTNFTDTVDLGLINGSTAGLVQLQAAANGSGTLTIQPGSYCILQ